MWLIFLCFTHLLLADSTDVITYEKGSRFGDNLVSYLHAKWISYKYQIPLRYKPFKYSSRLVLHAQEIRLSKDPLRAKRMAAIFQPKEILSQSADPRLYICPYFPEDLWEAAHGGYSRFQVDWKDKKFRKLVRKMIAPQWKLRLTLPPRNRVNIAIHVREGGGYDPESVRLDLPLKLPPMDFYLEGLSKIAALFPNQKILCHLFTDAADPGKIAELLKGAFPKGSNVKFTYREKNSHKENVLEDFFSFFNFDILIRPQSHFSMVPSLIHDYAIVYYPVRASVENGRVVIDQTNMEVNEELYRKALAK